MRVIFSTWTILLLTLSSALLSLPSIDAFAAGGKKNKGKGKNKTVVGKGFGSSNQPSVEEIVAKFPNRVPSDALETECPCGIYPGKLYKDCCEPFHSKKKLPAGPLDVLRSRYTAFVVSSKSFGDAYTNILFQFKCLNVFMSTRSGGCHYMLWRRHIRNATTFERIK